MLPYPVFLPIPLPLFLPIPVKPPSRKEAEKAQPQYKELDLCEGPRITETKVDNEPDKVDSVDSEGPLVVDIKREEEQDESENYEAITVDAEEVLEDPVMKEIKSNNSNKKNRKPKSREEEVRRKRRALIMDR